MLDQNYQIEGLHLERPLAVLDIEATGINRSTDRIIDLGIVKVLPDGTSENIVFRVHPERPIPPDSTAIHGITDEDVKDCPPFSAIAEHVAELLADCDFCGYNCIRFDLPMLEAEFARAKVPFNLDDHQVIDVQRIFHQREPRDLTAAVKYYCGGDHEGAHGALADVVATLRVLEGQFRKYPDLPRGMDELDAYSHARDPSWVDRQGRLRWQEGEVAVNFGKFEGRTLRDLVQTEAGFLRWMVGKDFPLDTKQVIQAALEGSFPSPPTPDADGD